ncbi:MAG: NAD(P)-binding protein [Candidatus Glassbacteria bacterium]|nr:NAD(P)-binding protein [Candidatus Glassbacteria bacterium]
MADSALTYRRYRDGDDSPGEWREWIVVGGESDLCPTYVHRTPPCQGNCPSGHDVRGWLNIVRGLDTPPEGVSWQEYAFRRMTDANPFPALMGRCCPAPCEDGCNRNQVEDHVGINAVEHYIGDFALEAGLAFPPPERETNKRVAVVGGGPAGLSCAYQLRRMGHAPVVFEANAKLGGMLQYGLSTHRCPRPVVDAEIKRILDMGIEVRVATRIGVDVSADRLDAEFEAVFWGIGAQAGRPLPCPGAEAANCIDGLAFLRAVNLGQTTRLPGKVLVIGGGDTALDCAAVSIRLGVEAAIVYRRSMARAPAASDDIEDVIAEGVEWRQELAPVEVMRGEDGLATALRVVPVEWIDNKKMVPRDGEEFDIPCAMIVAATGQRMDLAGIERLDNGEGWIDFDKVFGIAGRPGHFVGGDAIAPGLLTTAIGHGWKAAEGIDAYLRGEEPARRPRVDVHRFEFPRAGGADLTLHNLEDRASVETVGHDNLFLGHFTYGERNRRRRVEIAAEALVGNFDNRLIALDEEQAVAEAGRCMDCGLCLECDNCVIYCPRDAVSRVAKDRRTMGRYVETDYGACIGCHICMDVCPSGYIQMGLGG